MAGQFPHLADQLVRINHRIVDLQPITRNRYYHPAQQGIGSIKKVLPALVPELNYADLDGIQDGNMAMLAYQEAIATDTTVDRKDVIRKQLLDYCKLYTYSRVRIWQVLTQTGNAP